MELTFCGAFVMEFFYNQGVECVFRTGGLSYLCLESFSLNAFCLEVVCTHFQSRMHYQSFSLGNSRDS